MSEADKNKSKEFWGALPKPGELNNYFNDDESSENEEASEKIAQDNPWQEEGTSFSLSAKEKGVSEEILLEKKEDQEIETAISHSWSAFALG
jgi:hypothetical protein